MRATYHQCCMHQTLPRALLALFSGFERSFLNKGSRSKSIVIADGWACCPLENRQEQDVSLAVRRRPDPVLLREPVPCCNYYSSKGTGVGLERNARSRV